MSSTALAPVPPSFMTLNGTASAVTGLLQAPASGIPCVHWRLRVVEHVAPGMELVHEMVSPDPIELAWQDSPEAPPTTARLSVDNARIEAVPTMFREGTAGAQAVARQFGLRGLVRVEEVLIRQGEELVAEGILCDPSAALARGPFRGIDAPCELMEVTLRLGSLSLRPNLLPWALGTAAALLGTVSAAAALARWTQLHRMPMHVPGAHAEIGAAKPARPSWP